MVTVCPSQFVFCFQVDDGMRGWTVTGVQTCALPISPPERGRAIGGWAAVAGAGSAVGPLIGGARPTGGVEGKVGRRVRNRRLLKRLQNTRPYGYSMPIPVRYTQDGL